MNCQGWTTVPTRGKQRAADVLTLAAEQTREHPAGCDQGCPRPSAKAALGGEVITRVGPDYSWVLGHSGDAGCGCTSASTSMNEKNGAEEEPKFDGDVS